MAIHNDFGKQGELLAKQFLEEKGYEILDENWTYNRAEVDLIAYKDKKIIFIEVKTRSGESFGSPDEFVDHKKQKLLSEAAEEYIYIMQHQGEIRFDIISILLHKNSEKPKITHIEDAFWNY